MDSFLTDNGQAAAPSAHPLLIEVRRALTHLYDPVYLQRSPLVRLLGNLHGEQIIPGQEAKALRKVLLEAIDQLMPGENVPLRSQEHRIYAILRSRYVDQLSVEQLASSQGLSQRQVRRELRSGREAVASFLGSRMEWQDKGSNGGHCVEAEMQEWCLDAAPVNICVEVRSVEALVHPLAQEQGVVLRDSALPQSVVVQANRVLLRQMLLTLYTWFIRKHPHCTVESRVSQPDDGKAVFELACAGLSQCADAERDEAALLIPTELLQALQARLDRRLRVGAQHCLSLTLPCLAMHVVLLVDDNHSIHRLFKRYLSGLPYRVLSAYDARTGLAMARAERPDVVVTDIMMPDQDGWEMLGALQCDAATRDIPIVVCSVLKQETLARTLGVSGYIRKPVTQSTLLATLQALRLSGAP